MYATNVIVTVNKIVYKNISYVNISQSKIN